MTFTVTIPLWFFALIGGIIGALVFCALILCARNTVFKILGGGGK